MMNLLASVSQWEREVIGERTRDAMQHLKAQGRVYSRPLCEDEATVGRIQTERTHGRSYHAIAAGLTADGIPTVRGGRWQANTVRQIALRTQPCQERKVA